MNTECCTIGQTPSTHTPTLKLRKRISLWVTSLRSCSKAVVRDVHRMTIGNSCAEKQLCQQSAHSHSDTSRCHALLRASRKLHARADCTLQACQQCPGANRLALTEGSPALRAAQSARWTYGTSCCWLGVFLALGVRRYWETHPMAATSALQPAGQGH